MNAAGLVVVLAGTWVLCQVFGGNALVRLNIITGEERQYARKLN